MKIRRFFIAPVCAVCLSLAVTPSFAGKIGRDCTVRGKKLYGKVQVVDAFPDFKVQFVDAFPDFDIQYVDAFPGVP